MHPSGFWRARDTNRSPASKKGHVKENLHIYTYTYIHIYICVCKFVHTHIRIYIYTRACTHQDSGKLETQTVDQRARKGTWQRIYTYTYIYLCIYLYIYIYIYIRTYMYPSGFCRARDKNRSPASKKGHVTERNSSVPRSQPLFTYWWTHHATHINKSCKYEWFMSPIWKSTWQQETADCFIPNPCLQTCGRVIWYVWMSHVLQSKGPVIEKDSSVPRSQPLYTHKWMRHVTRVK